MKNKGKIIAVVGAPATGKSTLVRFLGKKLKAKIILEGEEKDVPKFIKDNISKDKNGFQTILWFHNRLVKQYLKALEWKKEEKVIVLDTFWLSNIFYTSTMLKNKKEREIITDMIKTTEKILPYPDIIIYLKSDKKTIKEWMEKRGRSFEGKFKEYLETISKEHEDYFKNKNIIKGSKIIKINITKERLPDIIRKIK